MTGPRIAPLDATLGAVAEGISLARLDDTAWATILDAFHQHALLVFPGQHLSEADQVAFARRFGEIEHIVAGLDLVPLTNQRPDGSLIDADTHAMRVLKGNEGWHTDSSYMPLAAKASVLSAVTVPSTGGQTEWADMRAAYDALDTATRDQVDRLSAHHSYYYSQARLGHDVAPGSGYGFHEQGAPLRPLVKIHPVTGRPALYSGRHACAIPGLSAAESERLLDGLLDASCRAPRTYEHAWEPGDLVVWDNRCVLHRARPYDTAEPRVMRHTRIAGDPATELAPTSAAVR